MSLSEDLLQQARDLSAKDRKKPKQANLRRAVSSAYYAFFHLFAAEAGSLVTRNRQLRPVVQRAFEHATMKNACKTFGGGTLPKYLTLAAPSGISPSMRAVANTFVELQQARHEADYNVNRRFLRKEVEMLLRQAESALVDWRATGSREKELFLLSLLLWKNWSHLH